MFRPRCREWGETSVANRPVAIDALKRTSTSLDLQDLNPVGKSVRIASAYENLDDLTKNNPDVLFALEACSIQERIIDAPMRRRCHDGHVGVPSPPAIGVVDSSTCFRPYAAGPRERAPLRPARPTHRSANADVPSLHPQTHAKESAITSLEAASVQ